MLRRPQTKLGLGQEVVDDDHELSSRDTFNYFTKEYFCSLGIFFLT